MKTTSLTKKRIIDYISEDKRFDERGLLDFRKISIKTGISNKAEGSAEVRIGDTRVIAGVKLGIMEPYPDSEDSGTLMVTSEMLPMSSEQFQYGPPSIKSIELARIIDRGIRESGFINFKELCIKKGKEVWAVMIDIYPLNDDGNLIDAAGLAAIAAISGAVMPKTKKAKEDEKTKVEFGEFTNKKLPTTDSMPVTLTFYKVGNKIILDPDTNEEEASSARISIAVSEDKKKEFINAIQKGGNDSAGTFTKEEVFNILDMAVKEQKKIREILKKSK